MSTLSAQLTLGDSAPRFSLPAHNGEVLTSAEIVGFPAILTFYLSDDSPTCAEQLSAFRDRYAEFEKLGARVIAVGVDSPQSHQRIAQQHQLPFPLLCDANAHVSLSFGAARAEIAGTQASVSLGRLTVLIDANHRIARIYRNLDPAAHAAEALRDVQAVCLPEEPRQILQQAPVLLIPNALPPELCRHLMEIWETQGNEDSGFMKQVDGRTVGLIDYSHKIRRDHFLREGPVRERLKALIGQRVVPEVRKAFNYEVTRFEDFRIACYDASRGGYFRAHRDNTTDGTAHRRFAMSLLLNDEYDGGYLRFPEYGRHYYRPGAGSAVVFSCSLLHEATDVTAGRRFVLLSFFYGEREAQIRQQYQQRGNGNNAERPASSRLPEEASLQG